MLIFSERLKELREQKQLSMMQLAKAIGVSDAAVCKWENGLAEPKASYIQALSEFFEVSTDYFLGLENDIGSKKYGTPKKQKKSPTDNLSAEEKELLENFRQLNLKNKMHVSSYARIRLEEQDEFSDKRKA